MLMKRFGQRAGIRKHMLVIMMVLMGTLGGSETAASASAGSMKEPTGGYAVFKQCPRFTAGVTLCLYAQITGGEMTLNKLTLPTVNPVTLQFGLIPHEGIAELTVVGSLDGETLSPTPQPVPGGLSSLIDCDEVQGDRFREVALRRACKEALEHSWFNAVNATTELAGPASEIYLNSSNEVNLEGTALGLPVRIHLENPLLGRDCYIGTSANPVVFNLTTGTTSPPPPNKPIKGKFGEIKVQDEFNLIELTEHVQVDNAFSAPEATGCGGPFSLIVDSLIDKKIGLPSPAGYNTVIHSGYADEATTVGVIASEQEEPHEKQGGKKWGRGTGPHRWWH
jgi:hypothetical protein